MQCKTTSTQHRRSWWLEEEVWPRILPWPGDPHGGCHRYDDSSRSWGCRGCQGNQQCRLILPIAYHKIFHIIPAAGSLSQLRGGCARGWVSSTTQSYISTTYCYKALEDKMDFLAAKFSCQKQRSILLEFDTRAEVNDKSVSEYSKAKWTWFRLMISKD